MAHYGVLKRWCQAGGYGFIDVDGAPAGEREVFMHHTAIRGGASEVLEGTRLGFDLVKDEGKNG